MTILNEPEPIRAECIFGVQRLIPLLEAFSKEINGVKTAQDIEHIHRMRVASRRIRAALPLFGSFIPDKKYRHWLQELQKITRALGDARDTDVQIEFITKLVKKRDPGIIDKKTDNVSLLRMKVDMETSLLLQLQKKRVKLQTVVVSTLEKLETSGIIDEMKTFFHSQIQGGKRGRKKPLPYGIPPVAAARISRRLNSLLSFERQMYNPDAVTEHHQMRIAAKKLRYTIEVYALLYRLGLKKYLVRVKKIQEILGDLHDCDVWIDTVMVLLLKERSTYRIKNSSKNKQMSRVSGLKQFLSDREKERKHLYARFVRYWDSLGRSGLWDNLRRTLKDGIKRKFRFFTIPSEDAVRSSVSVLANQFPEAIVHSRKVSALSLMMFDDLVLLHGMESHERLLLEYACALHDIGWKYGHKGHSKRSADKIVSDEHLLLDLEDRGIVALVSLAHRGEVKFESHGIFSLLPSKQRDTVLMLASLIRIADGLDYSHKGLVDSVHSTIHPDEVIVDVFPALGAAAEIERAHMKGDLFCRVFNRNLVIR